MARFSGLAPSGRTVCSTMMNVGLLQLLLVVMVIGERCTRAVPSVQEYPAKKVHVLRRVPAACSNWDKAWSWLTKVDCGTKYRLDYVTVPPREVKQYKLQYVCCDGDTNCKEADKIHSSGFNTTDEKFLAIVLGSVAACVVIIIIVFAITFYTRKTRCYGTCDQEGHVYASAEGDESADSNRENGKSQPEDIESETEQKTNEVEYAEITYPELPRYTDIFKENPEARSDPFNRATAPPLYSTYVNSESIGLPPMHPSSKEGIRHLMTSAPNTKEATYNGFEEIGPHQCTAAEFNDNEVIYYNVKEKKRGKRNSQDETANSLRENERRDRVQSASAIKCQTKDRRKNLHGSMSVEMIVKSSSASEYITKTSDNLQKKQKRLSAPPGSVDMPVLSSAEIHTASTQSASSFNMRRSNSNNTCSVINETVVNPQCSGDDVTKSSSLKYNQKPNPQRKSSRSSSSSSNGSYSIKNAGSKSSSQNSSKINITAHSTNITDLSNSCGLISPSNAVVLKCCDSISMELDCDIPQPTESDPLLNSLLSHSKCVNGDQQNDCIHFSNYDKLKHVSPDPDRASLHLYQCLDDVRKECQELKERSSSSSSEASLKKSNANQKDKHNVPKKNKSSVRSVSNSNKKQHRPEPC